MEAFIINQSNKETINHINGIKSDNRLVNLEWNTRSENCQHAWRIGLNKGNKGKVYPKGEYNKHSVKVNQYLLNGVYVKTWFSMADIERELGIKTSSISSICNNKQSRNSAKKYLFKFFKCNESCNNIIVKTKKSIHKCRWVALPSVIKAPSKPKKKVFKLDLNNNIIKKYNSVSEAANSIDGFVTNICSVCNGKMNTYKGFKWAYTEEGGHHY
jgi:hypothetical protein